MQTTQFAAGSEGEEIFCIHTDDQLIAVFVITPPGEWTAHASTAGVKRKAKRSDDWIAHADSRWDDTKLRIRFDTQFPLQQFSECLGKWQAQPNTFVLSHI